ncbi:MAG: hypothetical protein AAF468_08205 [Pseudomonadota bacterium]
MPLEILVILVVVGLTLVIGSVHLSGGSAKAGLTEDKVRARFAADFPAEAPAGIIVSADGMSALLFLDDQSWLGVAKRMGSKILTRHADRIKVTSVDCRGAEIHLTLADAGLPALVFKLNDLHSAFAIADQLKRGMGG